MQREFFSIIKERNRNGVTVFLSSHVLSEIQRNCSRAVLLREGRIVADVADLSGSELDFEERFMRYYEEGGAASCTRI